MRLNMVYSFSRMKRVLVIAFAVATLVATLSVDLTHALAEEPWTGRISDSMCVASHRAQVAAGDLTDRQCVIECIKKLAKYVLVDGNNKVVPIVNQDFPGLPFLADRMVKITGDMVPDGIVISAIEPLP